jgi:lipopolysaccharide/colanic/teichoic acid biosynthesis glycosyltransferase
MTRFVVEVFQKLMSKDTNYQALDRSIDDYPRQIKIFAESLLALLILLLSMPMILIAMVLVRITSRGPAIYAQNRLGRNGIVFTIYKIRTMYRDSEPEGARWCVPGDRRVTPIGRFLRCTHIDELPQLIQVLQGKMSLIGPRPERPEIVRELERALPRYRRRLNVRPGLTGLAQVLQPPDSDLNMVRSKLAFDLYYVDHWSLWLDLRIGLATILHILAVPPETISRLFRFPLVPIDIMLEEASPMEPSLVKTPVLPHLSEACNSVG